MMHFARACAVAVVVLSLTLHALAGDEQQEGRLITSSGTYVLFDGKLTVKVYEDKGNLVFDLVRPIKDGSMTRTIPTGHDKKELVWAILNESPNKGWVFWGSTLYRWDYESTDLGFKSSGKAFDGADAIKNAPPQLLKALPKEHVEKLKAK